MIDLVEFHSFFPKALTRQPVVLDLGANFGRFSTKMAERFGATCYAVEANPRIHAELEKRGVSNTFLMAMLDHKGEIPINLSDESLASSVIGRGRGDTGETALVPCCDLESFVEQIGVDHIDLVKVDIEGAEIRMFEACSDAFLKSIPQLTVEFHDFCGMTPKAEVDACLARFRKLGFFVIRFSRVGHQDTLLINTSRVNVNLLQLLYMKYVYRNLKGGMRMMRKLVLGKRWAVNYS